MPHSAELARSLDGKRLAVSPANCPFGQAVGGRPNGLGIDQGFSLLLV